MQADLSHCFALYEKPTLKLFDGWQRFCLECVDTQTDLSLCWVHKQYVGNAEPWLMCLIFYFSVFYVYYEQYLTIVQQTVMNLCICMAAIFVVTFILLGFDLVSALIAFIVITMIIIDIMGMMWMWDINLNALSLVNLVMVSYHGYFLIISDVLL